MANLKRYPRNVVIAEARRWASDPESAKRLMAVDEGPYTIPPSVKKKVDKRSKIGKIKL
jgi:hypothetical protein